MAKPASIFDMEDVGAEEKALREAEAQLDAGRGVPHSDVVPWLEDLSKGKRGPPPSSA